MKQKSINRYLVFLFGLVTPLLGVQAVMAQVPQVSAKNTTDKVQTVRDNVFMLGVVSVSGEQKTEAEKTETVVGRDEINLLEKKDIGTALSLVPGVLYNRPRGFRAESGVTVRGYSLREVPIFLDGVPVSIPYDGYSDLGRFTTSDVSSIHVAKGYSSVMYGHNTMGGAINVVSLRPRSGQDVSVTAGTGTGGMTELGVNMGTLRQNGYLQVGASDFAREYTPLAKKYQGKDAFGNTVDSKNYHYRTHDRRGSIKLGYLPNATDEYAFSYSKQEATKKPGNGRHGFVPFIQEWSEWDRETFSFVSNTRFMDGKAYLKPRVYYDTFKNSLDWFRNRPRGSHYDDKALGASVEVGTHMIDRHVIKVMVSLKDEQHREFDSDIYTRVQIGDAQKMKQKFVSAALEDTFSISDKWEMQAGAIYSRRTADAGKLGPNAAALIAAYPAAGSMLSPTIDTLDPQLAFFYKPSQTDTLRVSVSRKTRFPSFKQVYSNFGAGSTAKCPAGATGCVPGTDVPLLSLQNPGLAPEKATHYELGYVGSPIKGLTAEGSVYYSRARDAIARTDRDYETFAGYAITQNINLPGVVERKGIDVGLRYDATSWLAAGMSYAHLRIKNKENPGYRFTSSPRHFGMLYAEVRPMAWLAVTPSVEYRSNSYYDTAGNNKNGGYAVAGLKASFAPHNYKGITLNLGVDNMFDKNYADYNSQYASPGRAFYLNLRYAVY